MISAQAATASAVQPPATGGDGPGRTSGAVVASPWKSAWKSARMSTRMWWAVAVASARQHVAYRATVAASVLSNVTISVLRGHLALAVWAQHPHLAGYDAEAAVTFVVVGQALVTTFAVFGGMIAVPWRVEDGAIVVDLARPAGFQRWWLCVEIGRAGVFLASRAVPAAAVGVLLFDVRLPASPLVAVVFAASLVLALLVSFGIRYLVALSAFWLTDVRGIQAVASLIQLFFSGAVLPLAIFPGLLGEVARLLPFAATVQLPMDVYLAAGLGSDGLPGGDGEVAGALLFQAGWAAALLLAGRVLTVAAIRRLVVQGG